AMAIGARETFKSDYAIAVTGIAGPSGGSPEKPVGTVWIAVADENGAVTKRHSFGKDRLRNIELSAVYALDLLRKQLSAAS
ncbi:MAG TPA: CinA family protein, partial [Anaerolineales bacterium]|nr:CinA family protein [Anaerolineales bacterium]